MKFKIHEFEKGQFTVITAKGSPFLKDPDKFKKVEFVNIKDAIKLKDYLNKKINETKDSFSGGRGCRLCDGFR